MSKMNLDKKDRDLLAELDSNSRQTYLQIGKKLRLSKDTVKYRIERLEKTGIIEGDYAEINTKQLGYTIYRFYLKLQDLDANKKKALIDWLAKRRETFFIAEVIGPWDLSVLIWAKDYGELETFWNAFKQRYRHYLQTYLLSIFIKLHIFPRKYLGIKLTTATVEETQEKTKIDALDRKILRIIADHARLSFVETAQKINTNAKIAVYRLRRLEKENIILQYRTKINYALLGKQYFKVDINLNDTSRIKALHQFAFQHPAITYINQTLGATDFEFDAELDSFEKLTELINQIQEKFPGLIRDYSYFQILKVHKIKYWPE